MDRLWHPFAPLKIKKDFPVIEKAKGVYLWTEKGDRVIDGISSWWVNLHGHGHKELCSVLTKQALQLDHVQFGNLSHQVAIEFSTEWMKISPIANPKIFFSDNGSTSVEVSLKIVRQYWSLVGNKKKKKIIAFHGAYHGDTWGCMNIGNSISSNDDYFSPWPMEVVFIDPPQEERDVLKLKEIFFREGESIAAFIFEPYLQGVAGMRSHLINLLDEMIFFAKENNVFTIADECVTGFGRTGPLFVSALLKNKPDIMCLAKGITGGILPLGVTIVSNTLWSIFAEKEGTVFLHGHSYTANPISLRVAIKNLELLEREDSILQRKMLEKEHLSFKKILSSKFKVRVMGSVLAIDVEEGKWGWKDDRLSVMDHFFKKGLLMRPLSQTLYLMPPYCIKKKELNKCYQIIEEFLQS